MERSRKRRKPSHQVDGFQQSPSTAPKGSFPTTPLKKAPDGTTKKGTPATDEKKSSAVHDAWKEAKAKSQAQRGKRTAPIPGTGRALDVYDDIDGAHQQSYVKQKPSPASTPLKPRLDPLRNQRSGPASTSSPSKSAAAMGFFKQFHRPKASATGGETTVDNITDDRTSGFGQQDNGEVATTTSTSRTAEPKIQAESSPPIKQSGKPGWTYATQAKRTFEDEMREVAEAARERAERGDDDESAAALSRERRSKIRTFTPDGASTNSTNVVKTASWHKSRTAQKPYKQRQKDVRPDHDEAATHMEVELANAMGVDVLDEEDTQQGIESAENIQAALPETPSKLKAKQKTLKVSNLKDTTFAAAHLQAIQGIIIDKLTGKRPITLRNLEAEYSKVSSLITQSVTVGESNSMLLIGARGSGKSALVNQILREQAKDHQNDFHVVRLNGLIHTDDKIALREIWRQLGREMEVDEDETAPKNYADTLTTLLALLSHPAEQGREQQRDHITKSVVFVIDEFELFATHPRQTLLYNLFDIAQSRKAPIAVLGLTTRIDVAESLEKRVKSRFSHRYVHLAMSKSFNAFQEACKVALTLEREDLTETECELLGAFTKLTESLAKESNGTGTSPLADWNTFIDDLVSQDSFTNHLHSLYYTSKSVPEFHNSMLLPISTLITETSTSAVELAQHITTTLTTTSLQPPDSKLAILASLSTLHLALLICAARLTAIHSIDNVPFVQVYEEYKALASKAKLQASAAGALAQGAANRVWSKGVARNTWADLVGCGLVLEDGVRGCRVDVSLEEVGMAGVELGVWGRWCKQI